MKKNIDSAASESSSDDEGIAANGEKVRKLKVAFGDRRKVKKQRKDADSEAHLYVEVRDATGLPGKLTKPYVSVAIVEISQLRGVPFVQVCSCIFLVIIIFEKKIA